MIEQFRFLKTRFQVKLTLSNSTEICENSPMNQTCEQCNDCINTFSCKWNKQTDLKDGYQ